MNFSFDVGQRILDQGMMPHCISTDLTLPGHRPDRNEMSVLAGSLDNSSVIQPSEHIFVEQRCNWLHVDDGLPSYDRFPPGYEDREF